jgi:hypothetical protein
MPDIETASFRQVLQKEAKLVVSLETIFAPLRLFASSWFTLRTQNERPGQVDRLG